jgi:hypothetical protein
MTRNNKMEERENACMRERESPWTLSREEVNDDGDDAKDLVPLSQNGVKMPQEEMTY